MPSVIFPGPEGRLEGRFQPAMRQRAPVAMILHPHSQGGGTMNDRIVQRLYKTFVDRGFATLRFNFRGVGRSQGSFDNGVGELSDAASALDWVQSIHPEAETTWVAGVSFGAWIGMQLLMRRPEIRGFISIAPPANMYDFSFLAPCPSSGIIIQGEADEVAIAHLRRDPARFPADHLQPLVQAEHRRLGRIGRNPDHQPVHQPRRPADDVHMAERDRIETARIDAGADHVAALPGRLGQWSRAMAKRAMSRSRSASSPKLWRWLIA